MKQFETRQMPGRTIRYLFFARDPLLDDVVSLIRNDGRSYKDLAAASGVSDSTIASWDKGLVYRPQGLTMANVLASMGKRINIVNVNEKIIPIHKRRAKLK